MRSVLLLVVLVTGCADHTVEVNPPKNLRCHAVIDGIKCSEERIVMETWCQCVGDV